MNLRDRLYEIDTSSLSKRGSAPPGAESGIDRHVAGEYIRTPYGSCFVARRFIPADAPQPVASIFALPHKSPLLLAFAGKNLRLQRMKTERTLFLDTETTGLAGGTGTYIFLIGIGFFTEGGFQIEQYFMRSYDEELAMLHCLSELLADAEGLISFNGSGYDIPLLKTRFTLARFDTDCYPQLHLDLLFAARRLWRTALESFALSSLEQHIIGVQRRSDVPSHMIPGIYFNYVRKGEAAPLREVFDHNFQDVLSLAMLAAHMSEMFESPPHLALTDQEYLSIARIYEELRLFEKSSALYEALRGTLGNSQVRDEITMKLGRNYKRQGKWDKAVAMWEELTGRSTAACIELAKYFEHVARDHDRALHYVSAAMRSVELWELIDSPEYSAEMESALEHRRGRLLRKVTA